MADDGTVKRLSEVIGLLEQRVAGLELSVQREARFSTELADVLIAILDAQQAASKTLFVLSQILPPTFIASAKIEFFQSASDHNDRISLALDILQKALMREGDVDE